MVHFYRNVCLLKPRGMVKEMAAMLQAIHVQEDLAAAHAKAEHVIEKLQALRLGKAAELLNHGIGETLSYMAFPREHRT